MVSSEKFRACCYEMMIEKSQAREGAAVREKKELKGKKHTQHWVQKEKPWYTNEGIADYQGERNYTMQKEKEEQKDEGSVVRDTYKSRMNVTERIQGSHQITIN